MLVFRGLADQPQRFPELTQILSRAIYYWPF